MYFTPVTEKAIIAYNDEKNQTKRNKIYSEHIHYPVWKLAQNIINRFKFPYMNGTTEDKQYEVIGFLLQKLGKYTDSLLAVDRQRDVVNEQVTNSRKESLKDFTDLFVEKYDDSIDDRFNKDTDKKIAYAVIELFRRRENIEKYNKKALYVLIREMTNEKTQDISRVVNVIKRDFKEKYKIYERIARN